MSVVSQEKDIAIKDWCCSYKVYSAAKTITELPSDSVSSLIRLKLPHHDDDIIMNRILLGSFDEHDAGCVEGNFDLPLYFPPIVSSNSTNPGVIPAVDQIESYPRVYYIIVDNQVHAGDSILVVELCVGMAFR